MSWQPGLITHIDDEGMSVKVRTGADCAACPGKMACTFQGPEAAYRTLRVRRIEGCVVGERLLVDEPASVLAVALLVVVALPVALMLTGYGLAMCCVQFPYATLVLWVSGTATWVGGLYAADRWMTQSPRFQTAVRRSITSNKLVQRPDVESEEA